MIEQELYELANEKKTIHFYLTKFSKFDLSIKKKSISFLIDSQASYQSNEQ